MMKTLLRNRLWLLVLWFLLCTVQIVGATAPGVNPRFTAISSTGAPWYGAQLYTYVTGTTTPKTTWTDATKGTPNTNPITLDQYGQADVWLDSSTGGYRLRLVDPDGVVIWTKDAIYDSAGVASETVAGVVRQSTNAEIEAGTNVTAFIAPDQFKKYNGLIDSVAALKLRQGYDGEVLYLKGYTTYNDGGQGPVVWNAASTATADDGITFAVTGVATGRWIRQINGYVTPLMFGGYTSTAIQAAINYVSSLSNQISLTEFANGTAPKIRIPQGIYNITEKLTIPGGTGNRATSIHIIGDGKYLSVLRVQAGLTGATLTSLFDFPAINPPTTDSNNQWTIEDLGMEGPSDYSTHGIDCINAPKSSYFNLKNCFIRYFDKGLIMRNWSNKVLGNTFEYNNTCVYITEADGIGGQSTINDLVFSHNIFGTFTYGIHAARSLPINMLSIVQNQFDGLSRAAILLNGTVEHVIIKNNYFEVQGRAGQATIQTNNTGGTALVDGAIILHPTTNNELGANGEITNNYFVNCNLTSTISMSGNSKINIDENTLGGLETAAFVSILNPSGITLGPLSYSSTQLVRIAGSTKSAIGTVRATKLVNIDNTLGAGRYSYMVIDDKSSMLQPEWFVNDIRNATKISTATIGLSRDTDGMQVFTHATADGGMTYRYTFTVTPNSPLSGAFIRFAGQAYGDNGTVNWIATIIDSGVTSSRTITATTAGNWGTCRNQVFYIPVQSSGSRNITIDIDRTGTAENAKLKGFSICAASFDIGKEPILQ